jgi:hypothetical protein
MYSLFNSEHVTSINGDGSSHNDMHIFQQTHNFFDYYKNSETIKELNMYQSLLPECRHQEAIDWFKDTLKFNDSNLHIVLTHGVNINLLINSIGVTDCKVINIINVESDLDQLCYNFVIKAILPDPSWSNWRAQFLVDHVIKHFPIGDKLSPDHIAHARETGDIKFLCWVTRLFRNYYFLNYQSYVPNKEISCYNIYRKDIPKLVDSLPELADFVGAELSDQITNNCVNSIRNYASFQQQIPFKINLTDYYLSS